MSISNESTLLLFQMSLTVRISAVIFCEDFTDSVGLSVML